MIPDESSKVTQEDRVSRAGPPYTGNKPSLPKSIGRGVWVLIKVVFGAAIGFTAAYLYQEGAPLSRLCPEGTSNPGGGQFLSNMIYSFSNSFKCFTSGHIQVGLIHMVVPLVLVALFAATVRSVAK